MFLTRFPSHSIPVDSTKHLKQKTLNDLREKLRKEEIKVTYTYFVTLPIESVHTHRLIGTTRHMNEQIKEKIHEFVTGNITNARLIKRLMQKYVQSLCATDLVQPHITDRAYYPLEKDIANCVHSFISAGKYSHLDQLQLEKIINEWISNNSTKPPEERIKVYFRKSCVEPNSDISSSVDMVEHVTNNVSEKVSVAITGNFADFESDDSDHEDADSTMQIPGTTFLFVYQETWQQKLLLKYGNILSLLDATYKTTKYALPLFLLCVQTNCGYVPVAQFIIEQESALHIGEALKIISSWNTAWNPPYL